jgi:hypothetical protein
LSALLWAAAIIGGAVPIVPRLRRSIRENFARQHDDFAIFYRTASRLFQRGENPYPLDPSGRIAPNLNPPHAHVLFAPVLLWSRPAAYVIWLSVSALALLATAAITIRLLPEPPTAAPLLLAAALLSGSGLTMATVASGQIYAVLTLPLTIAWLESRHGCDGSAGAIVGVLATVKPSLALVMAGWLCSGNWTSLAASALAAVLTMGVGLMAFGRQPYEGWLRSLPRMVASGHFRDGALMQALARVFSRNGHFPPLLNAPFLIRPIWIGVSIVLVLVTLLWAPPDPDRWWLRLLSVSFLVSPKGWIYGAWWIVGPAIFVATASSLVSQILLVLAAISLWLPDRSPLWGQPSAALGASWGSLYLWTWSCLWLAAA